MKFNTVNNIHKIYTESSHCKSIFFESFQHRYKLGIAVFLPIQLEALDLETCSEGTIVIAMFISLIPAQPFGIPWNTLGNIDISRNTASKRALPHHQQLLSPRLRILSQMVHENFAIVINSLGTSDIAYVAFCKNINSLQQTPPAS